MIVEGRGHAFNDAENTINNTDEREIWFALLLNQMT